MLVQEIMSVPAWYTSPQDTVASAVVKMKELGIGVLPVVVADRIVGILTDRDLVLALAEKEGALAGLTIAAVMNCEVICCCDTDTIETAAAIMGDHQIRRLPVVDDHGRLTGLLSVTDIAVHGSEQIAGEALGEIAEYR